MLSMRRLRTGNAPATHPQGGGNPPGKTTSPQRKTYTTRTLRSSLSGKKGKKLRIKHLET